MVPGSEELQRTVWSVGRQLAEIGPGRVRAEGDFERVSLPNHDGDVLRDVLAREQVRIVVEVSLAYDIL
jgi:hypothetical protein